MINAPTVLVSLALRTRLVARPRALAVLLGLAACQAPAPTPEPGVDEIRPLPPPGPAPAPPPAILEVADGFSFLEGPVRGPDGRLYFADVLGNAIHSLDPRSDGIELWREDSGGASGLAFGPDQALYVAEAKARRVSILTRESRRVLVDAIDGKRLNGPNDIAVDDQGGVYFSDPFFGDANARELEREAIYYVPPGAAARAVVTDLRRPNGVLLGDRGRRLYVTDHAAGRLLYYPVLAPGQLGDAVELATGLRRPDGLAEDRHGAVYVANAKGISVFGRKGKRLEVIALPSKASKASNCAFAGSDGTLYVTTKQALLRVNVPRARKRAGGREKKGAQPVSVATTERARALYATSCASCHGASGRGDGPSASGLEAPVRSFADAAWQKARKDADIRRAIVEGGASKGADGMPAHPDLADEPELLRALVREIRGFGGKR